MEHAGALKRNAEKKINVDLINIHYIGAHLVICMSSGASVNPPRYAPLSDVHAPLGIYTQLRK